MASKITVQIPLKERLITFGIGVFLISMFKGSSLAYLGMPFIVIGMTPGFILSAYISILRFFVSPIVYLAPIIHRRMVLRGVFPVSSQKLDAMRNQIVSGRRLLDMARVFNPYEGDLLDAWKRRDAATVQALLKQGDEETRSAAESLTTVLNTVSRHIDKARGNLRRMIRQSERMLARFNIKPDDARLKRSGSYSMEVKPVLTAGIGPRQVDTRAVSTSVGRIGTQVYQGNMSWQAGGASILAGVAIALVTQHIFNSRALRRLKEAEGKLAEQADAIAKSLSAYRIALATQLLPHFDELASLTRAMEASLGELKRLPVTVDAPPELAFRLAMTLREAKHYLQVTG